jgi:hypothetical protein
MGLTTGGLLAPTVIVTVRTALLKDPSDAVIDTV